MVFRKGTYAYGPGRVPIVSGTNRLRYQSSPGGTNGPHTWRITGYIASPPANQASHPGSPLIIISVSP